MVRQVTDHKIPESKPYAGPPTQHTFTCGSALAMPWIADASVHLVVTSPPYYRLKQYAGHSAQLDNAETYEDFLGLLDRVWAECFRVLVPGGRLVCNVGDVCLSRRSADGRHHVLPLHADISVRARSLGFDYLTPILWNKIANANFESGESGGGGFLGKPYEPNAIIKSDLEYLLMLRKPGAYRSPSMAQRESSRLSKKEQATWFQPIWTDIQGAPPTKEHPAPFPEEIATRLIRMFSFTEDVVLDPFGGSGTTSVAAWRANRHSLYNDVEISYRNQAEQRLKQEQRQQRWLW